MSATNTKSNEQAKKTYDERYAVDYRQQLVGYEKTSIRFRAHLFSYLCTYARILKKRRLRGLRDWLLPLDYTLFRRIPNGASMIGMATKGK